MEHEIIHSMDVIDAEVSQENMRAFVEEIENVNVAKCIAKMIEAEKQQFKT